MHKILPWLGGLLALQLVIVLLFVVNDNRSNAAVEPASLVEFSQDTIDEITITDEESQKATIKKVGDQWLLPNYEDLPIKASSVAFLLTKLHGLERYWPVAKTAETLERFKVSEDVYVRKVELKSNEEVVSTLFFGTSPSFKKINARVNDESIAYSVELNQHDLKAKDKDWLDKSLLAHKGNIDKIVTDDIKLTKGDQWTIEDLNENETLDSSEVDKLVSAIRGINIEDLAAQSLREAISDKAPEKTLTIQSGDKEIHYLGFKDDNKFIIKSATQNILFTIAEYQFNKLFDLKRENFVKAVDDSQVVETEKEVKADDKES